MKKLIFVTIAALAAVFTSSSVSAQGISVEIAGGGNSPGGDFAELYEFGFGVAIHPRFNISDKMAVGLNLGFDGFASGDIVSGGSGGSVPDLGVAAITTILGTIQYKLLDRKISPYGEVGIGVYKYKPANLIDLSGFSGNTDIYQETSYFGFAPKIGAMIGLLNGYIQYHAAGDLSYTQMGLGFRFGSK